MRNKGNYGIDSPGIMFALLTVGLVLLFASLAIGSRWRWPVAGLGFYFLIGAGGMLFYSKVGKLGLANRLLDRIPWRGNEKVLDVGCGRGLLAVTAAHRLSSGSVVGVDVWNRGAVSGNCRASVLENARVEGVSDRVEVKNGDARALPFADESFDVIVSNYVVHELRNRTERERMIAEISRVLKPAGYVAINDFIFTADCVQDLRRFGVEAQRVRDGRLSFWISAILNFGSIQPYQVIGRKRQTNPLCAHNESTEGR